MKDKIINLPDLQLHTLSSLKQSSSPVNTWDADNKLCRSSVSAAPYTSKTQFKFEKNEDTLNECLSLSFAYKKKNILRFFFLLIEKLGDSTGASPHSQAQSSNLSTTQLYIISRWHRSGYGTTSSHAAATTFSQSNRNGKAAICGKVDPITVHKTAQVIRPLAHGFAALFAFYEQSYTVYIRLQNWVSTAAAWTEGLSYPLLRNPFSIRRIQAYSHLQLSAGHNPILVIPFFLIPYVIIFGLLFTFLCLNFGENIFVYNAAMPNLINLSGATTLSQSAAIATTTASPLSMSYGFAASSLINLGASFWISLNSTFMGVPFIAIEILRLANYSSKIFIVWGFLKIWKGIRTGPSSKDEYIIQTRIFIKNKKRFTDIEGITKFLPILKTCVESLQFKNYSSNIWRWLSSFQSLVLQFSLGRRDAMVMPAYRNYQLTPRPKSYPKGYLFIGPPGTGKTLLAQAVAGEAGVPLICLSASEIQKQIDIGTKIGAIRLRNLFLKAKQKSPCILFFDEIDSIGRGGVTASSLGSAENTSFSENGSAECDEVVAPPMPWPGDPTTVTTMSTSDSLTAGVKHDITLFTEFLIQMDSVRVEDKLIIIGTTNFFTNLDCAFIRSGRFDRIIGLQYPGTKTRFDLLKLYTQKQGCEWDIKDGFTEPSNPTKFLSLQSDAAPPLPSQGSKLSTQKVLELTTAPADTALLRLCRNPVSVQSKDLLDPLMYFAKKTKGFTAADLAKVANESLLYICKIKLKEVNSNSSCKAVVHTYKSLEQGIKKISSRDKYL
jgi:adenylate kinase family enzyme